MVDRDTAFVRRGRTMTQTDEPIIVVPDEPRREASPSPRKDRPTPRDPSQRDNWVLIAALSAMACLVVAIVAVGLAFRYADEGGGGGTVTGDPVTVQVELGEF